MVHHDDHDHEETGVALRVKALEKVLTEKGVVDPSALDRVVEIYETKIGPRNGAKVVARAWVDADYKERLLKNGAEAIAEFGFSGIEGNHIRVIENTDKIHNVVVCTLCSCYPWPVLGLPPVWYKSLPYRSRIVREPRAVLEEFGMNVPADTEIRVWDSSADLRYMVLPQRPKETAGWDEESLAKIVTRDGMIGTAAV